MPWSWISRLLELSQLRRTPAVRPLARVIHKRDPGAPGFESADYSNSVWIAVRVGDGMEQ
jgi:hypothetical protein